MHTPGPWIAEKADAPLAGFVVRRMIGRISSVIIASLYYDEPQAETNARLMAASPDLLEVLKDLHANCVAADEYMRAAEFVIAKAEGKS